MAQADLRVGRRRELMLTAEENDILTLVSGDAPMGKLMRQHWTPVCLMEEVAEPDGKPLRVEVLGESSWPSATPTGGWGCSTSVPAPQGVAGLWPQRGMRPALPLPRLEDGRGGQRRRHVLRARGQPADGQGQGARLPLARMGRLRLGLARRQGRDAGIPAARLRAGRGHAGVDPQDPGARQLGADPRGPDRQRASSSLHSST